MIGARRTPRNTSQCIPGIQRLTTHGRSDTLSRQFRSPIFHLALFSPSDESMKLTRILLRIYTATLRAASGFIARKLKNNFYLLLAGLFTLFVLADVYLLHAVVDMRQKAYDVVIKNRIIKPKPDSDIVIVDVNEKSLSAMAKDYGRWPWPRQVLGEFVENVELQKPKAIIFDILFSDADVFNPDSDAAFNETIAGTNNTFFPMLRLPPDNDKLSELRPQMIPGIKAIQDETPSDHPIAMVLPFFKAALDSARLGTHNIYPDGDGVARAYRMHHDEYGWRIPSLPSRVGEILSWQTPEQADILLNWRGQAFTYSYASFSDVYLDMLNKDRKRAQNEFTGKIVIIGSTAPSMGDIKATSMAKQFPGVEILATAIDNVKHDDFIRVPKQRWPLLLAALIILWGTAYAFYKDVEPDRFAKIFGFSQIGLLAISYLTINLTNFYFNLAGPVFIAFVYFSVAKLYAIATAKALQKNVVAHSLRGAASVVATMALFEIGSPDELALPSFLRALKNAAEKMGSVPKDVEMMRGSQRGVWGVLDNLLVVTWAHAVDDHTAEQSVAREANELIEAMPKLIAASRIAGETLQDCTLHALPLGIDGAPPTESQWRRLFAETLEKMRTT
jgi:CHASE2 domain-containing sensor protein